MGLKLLIQVAALVQKVALKTGGRELKQKVLLEQVETLKAEVRSYSNPLKVKEFLARISEAAHEASRGPP